MTRETLTETFITLAGKLHRAAVAILGNEHDAKDAIQDAYLKLFEASERSADASSGHDDNRLLTTLRHICIDRLRRAKPTTDRLPEMAAPSSQDADCVTADDYAALIRQLPPRQQQVFRMVVYGEMDYDVVALRLGMSDEAVRQNMSRARKKLYNLYVERRKNGR